MTYRYRLAARLGILCMGLLACADRTGEGSDQGGLDSTGESDDGEDDSSAETETGDGDGSSSGEETGTEDESTGEDTGGMLPPGFCADACTIIVDGSCLTTESCEAYCEEHSGDWELEVGEAFRACAETDPVCFISVEGCMLGQLHPQGSEHRIVVSGTGLDEAEGKTIHVWHDPDKPTQFGGQAEIVDGGFEFEWFEPVDVWDQTGPLMLSFVDMDDDGECDPQVDLTESINTEWDGDFLDPTYQVVLEPPFGPKEFVCNFLP